MNLFRYIYNLVTGRVIHWNRTNNHIVNTLWERSKRLGQPQKLVYSRLIIASAQCMEYLLSPHIINNERIINIDIRKISFQQYKELYTLLLSSMARTYESLNPSLSSVIRRGYKEISGVKLEGSPMPLFYDDKGEPDFQRVTSELWESFLKIINIDHDPSIIGAYSFSVLYLSSLTDAADYIKSKISDYV